MNVSKKILALVLAMVMAISCFSVCAFATLSYYNDSANGELYFFSGTSSEVDSYIENFNEGDAHNYSLVSVQNISGIDFSALLEKFSEITTLYVINCGVVNIDWISTGSNLVTVNLSNNSIWDLRPIASATTIKTLTLDKNLITNVMPLFTNHGHIYSDISLINNFISDIRGINSSYFDGSVTTYLNLNYNFIQDFNNWFSGTILQGHVEGNGTQKPIPDDPFVAIVENNVSKIVGYFGNPNTKEVTVGANAYTLKSSTYQASGLINNATQIAVNAFKNNVNVDVWNIGSNINYIDSFAFGNCTSINRIHFAHDDNDPLTIKGQAFFACTNLLGICIPSSVTTIERKTFDLCKRLKYVEFSNKDTSVHSAAFYRCNEEYLTIYVSSAINDTLWQTSTLKSSLDNLLYVSNYTLDRNLEFSNGTLTNASLNGTTFRVPAGLDKIQIISAISCGLNGLSKFLMPEGVSEAQISFTGTTENDIEMLVPQTLTDITDISFANVSFLTNPDTQETSKVIAYTYGNTSVTNTNCTINTDYEIAYDVLEKCLKTLTSNTYLTLPNLGYDIIGSFAFYGIDTQTGTYNSLGNYIKSVTLPNGIIEIETCAFKRLKLMQSITFNDDGMLKTIGEQAFNYCLYLNNVVIPSSVETIGGEAFYYCTRLTSVTFDLVNSELTEIGDGAFRYCHQMQSIELPHSIIKLGDRVFKDDSDLETINFGSNPSLTSIGQEIFQNCTSLNNNDPLVPDVFKIPDGVKLIPAYAFAMGYGTYGDDNNSFCKIVLPNAISQLTTSPDPNSVNSAQGVVNTAFEYFDGTDRTIEITCSINDTNRGSVISLWNHLHYIRNFTVLPDIDDIMDTGDGIDTCNYDNEITNSPIGANGQRSIVNDSIDKDFNEYQIILKYMDSHNDFDFDLDELLYQITLAESMYYSSQI